MARKDWNTEEEKYLEKNYKIQTSEEIGKVLGRSRISVQKKVNYLGLNKRNEEVVIGNVINGWEIIDVYTRDVGSQNLRMAKVRSILGDGKESQYRLTLLTQGKVGWPDRRRPDVTFKNTTHGLTGHRLNTIWNGIKSRCYYPSQLSYKNYGARGIVMCKEWLEDFMTFYNWAINNGYKDSLTLDRIDNAGNYEPSNCRWLSYKEQNDRRSVSVIITAWGETKNASDWALDERCKTTYASLCYRIKVGWRPEYAISSPTRSKNKRQIRRFKQFYDYVKDNHPEIIDDFLSLQ